MGSFASVVLYVGVAIRFVEGVSVSTLLADTRTALVQDDLS